MTTLRQLLPLVVVSSLLAFAARAEEESSWRVEALDTNNWADVDLAAGTATGTNGILIQYERAVLTADRAKVNLNTGDAEAEGHVRLMREDQVWVSEQLSYNFKTKTMRGQDFRTGKSPVFAGGRSLEGDASNKVVTARGAFVTTDDVDHPFSKVRASSITITPGKRIIARNATLYLGGVPVLYFPFYTRSLDPHGNHLDFVPGYRSKFGPYLLGSYKFFLDEQLDGTLHLDYRVKRGMAAGPDLNLHLGRWGEAELKYYYVNDDDPNFDANGLNIPVNRHRVAAGYDATPWTNLNVKAAVSYQNDPLLLHDFFESEYRRDPQPKTFVEVNKFWDNFSLDVYTQPRVNSFLETVEHLPEVRLTGWRQQLGDSPIYYESETSAGYYRRLFAETNGIVAGLNYEATRADTYHQLVWPDTLFGWLNLTPRIGARFTYYGRATGPGATTDEEYRGVVNTGAEISFKASRLWPGAQNKTFDVDGLRHIVEPSVNYVYVPRPNVTPDKLPQFTYESPSLRLLPIEYPDHNSIDSVDSQNVLRLGLANKFQTKRDGQIEDLVRWDVYTDWRLSPRTNQTDFADVWSDLLFRPRSWLTLESQLRFDVDHGELRSSFTSATLQPNDVWSWTVGHWYVHDDFTSPLPLGVGNDVITSSLFYRASENWSFRASHHYEARLGILQEQLYTFYRDFRSWTGALTFLVRDNTQSHDEYAIAFTFSLKASPKFPVGGDTVHPYQLIGN